MSGDVEVAYAAGRRKGTSAPVATAASRASRYAMRPTSFTSASGTAARGGARTRTAGRGGGGAGSAVAEADGVPLRIASQWAIIDQLPDDLTTSAARDIAAGRRSELDAIVGAVLRAGERLGVQCPTLAELAANAGLQ